MIGKAIIGVFQPRRIQRFQRLPGGGMQRLAAGRQETLVGHLLGQGVLEHIHGSLGTGALKEKLLPRELEE